MVRKYLFLPYAIHPFIYIRSLSSSLWVAYLINNTKVILIVVVSAVGVLVVVLGCGDGIGVGDRGCISCGGFGGVDGNDIAGAGS